jgi:hypothetical protein
MRFMILVKATKASEAGALPSTELLARMGAYNKELVDAGVLVDGDGLRPSAEGARVRFAGAGRVVTRGPFAATGELVSGYWIWKLGSMEEAVRWLGKAPFADGEELEIRRIAEPEDFGENLTDELRENERRLRERSGGKG